MTYVSSTVNTASTSFVSTGSTNQAIIQIQVVTSGNASPITASSFTLNTTGTTNVIDLSKAKLFATGTSNVFATTTQLSGDVNNPSGTYTINSGANLPYMLSEGTNYFWLVYDISPTATLLDYVDAECTSITVGGTPQTPTVTAPAGNRQIKNVVQIGAGTSTQTYPFYTNWGYTRSASLYTSAEVGTSMNISRLNWNVTTSTVSLIPIKIYAKVQSGSALTSDT